MMKIMRHVLDVLSGDSDVKRQLRSDAAQHVRRAVALREEGKHTEAALEFIGAAEQLNMCGTAGCRNWRFAAVEALIHANVEVINSGEPVGRVDALLLNAMLRIRYC